MRKVIFISSLVLLLIVTGYVYWFYYNVYGEGYRSGYCQKFSRKGNIFKTYEGELVQEGFKSKASMGGINAQYFYFSVADEKIADSLEKCLEKVVTLHYIQYRRALPWRGDRYKDKNLGNSQYVVDRIESVSDMEAPDTYR